MRAITSLLISFSVQSAAQSRSGQLTLLQSDIEVTELSSSSRTWTGTFLVGPPESPYFIIWDFLITVR